MMAFDWSKLSPRERALLFSNTTSGVMGAAFACDTAPVPGARKRFEREYGITPEEFDEKRKEFSQ
jgi:hypothetical protein